MHLSFTLEHRGGQTVVTGYENNECSGNEEAPARYVGDSDGDAGA
jgi:hypothetical protein